MKNLIYLILLLIITINFSCNRQPLWEKNQLEWALQYSKNNRPELEKVLLHYSKNIDDTLKLKAAVFLIANMPGHYSYDGNLIYEYYDKADSILSIEQPVSKKIQLLKDLTNQYPDIKKHIKEDVFFITSDYLIHQIEKAFEAWKIKPWASQLTFDDFCEFLLPYKCTELQELDYWRDSLEIKYTDLFTNSVIYVDETRNSTFDAAHTLTTELKNAIRVELIPLEKPNEGHHPLLSSHHIDQIQCGYCEDYSIVSTVVMRSHGIPIVMDYVPKWGRMMGGHHWNVVLNTHGDELRFDGITGDWPGAFFGPLVQSKPKVYRKTYAINKTTLHYVMTAKYIVPELRNPFQKDVTEHYVNALDMEIPITTEIHPIDSYAYLSVFDFSHWKVLDYGKIKNNKALFKKAGRDVVYLAQVHDGDKMIAIANPFILKIDGSIEFLNPDTINTRSVTLTRKYYRSHHVAFMEKRLIRGKIQASHYPDFKEVETFYQIDSIWTPYQIPINEEKKSYRYWRYIGPNGSFSNIAELMFWQRKDTVPLYGKIIGSNGSFNNDSTHVKEMAFDREALTSFDGKEPDGCWIGMDYGQRICIDRVTCIPRSDDNAISPGEKYELNYWNNKGWVSLGKKIATDKVIVFDQVPENALLLLRNLSKGRQERIFTYENEKQIWW